MRRGADGESQGKEEIGLAVQAHAHFVRPGWIRLLAAPLAREKFGLAAEN